MRADNASMTATLGAGGGGPLTIRSVCKLSAFTRSHTSQFAAPQGSMAAATAALGLQVSPPRAQRSQPRQQPRARLLVTAQASAVQTGTVTSPAELLGKEKGSSVDLVHEYNKSASS